MKNGIKTPAQVNANKENIQSESNAKMSPNTPKAMIQMLEASPSIPSIKLIALVMKTTSYRVKGIPKMGDKAYIPNKPYKLLM